MHAIQLATAHFVNNCTLQLGARRIIILTPGKHHHSIVRFLPDTCFCAIDNNSKLKLCFLNPRPTTQALASGLSVFLFLKRCMSFLGSHVDPGASHQVIAFFLLIPSCSFCLSCSRTHKPLCIHCPYTLQSCQGWNPPPMVTTRYAIPLY